jgi:cytochrome c553
MRFLFTGFFLATGLSSPLGGFEKSVLPILQESCLKCHGDEKVKGGVDFSKILTQEDADANFELWETVVEVIEAGEMPPEDEPELSEAQKKTITDWFQKRKKARIEARPSVFAPRRLSGPEYRNTLRSLFGFDLEVAVMTAEQTVAGEQSLVLKLLPTDPPGDSGFVNDTHRARLSPVVLEQYHHLGRAALEKLFSPSGRRQLGGLIGESLLESWRPEHLTSEQAGRLLRAFAPRALRRPVSKEMLSKMLSGIEGKKGAQLLAATKFELQAILLSPAFFYRGLLMKGEPGKQQAVDSYELAERLSYFLWEDSPDEELTRLAAHGSLGDEKVINSEVVRMLSSPKARSLAESFGEQWLALKNLDDLVGRDPIRHHALKGQIVEFLDYLFTGNRPVMELIDSKVAFVNQATSGFYGRDRQQLKRFHKAKGIERQRTPHRRLELVHAEGRGGLLTMPGILTMNQGPIQRGTWMLRRILGVRVGEPPADTPPIKGNPPGKKLTFRERFEEHRSHASCARCHEKIDPLGFALEGYDKNGQFLQSRERLKQTSPEIDTSGKLPGGETFEDFAGLKSILLTSQREVFVRNVVKQTLAYALCRKLTHRDQAVVEDITKNLCENNGTWLSLFQQVVNCLPFRETIIEAVDENDE